MLFSSLALMFLVLALSSAGTHRRRLAYALLGGVGLGCYLLTWSGGALLVAIIVAWATLQMVIEGLRGRAGTEVALAVVPGLFVAGLMILPWTRTIPYFTLQMIAVGAGVVIVLFLRGLADATQNLVRGRTVYLAALLITGAASVLLAEWMARDSSDAVFGQLARFSPGRTLAIAGEARRGAVAGLAPKGSGESGANRDKDPAPAAGNRAAGPYGSGGLFSPPGPPRCRATASGCRRAP